MRAPKLTRRIPVPMFLTILVPLLAIIACIWALALSTDRNPLPFPDRHYHVFSTSSEPALIAMEEVMMLHGYRPRFRADSDNVQRTIFSNGTILNRPEPSMLEALGHPGGALGFVVTDPDTSARQVADMLRQRGFHAESIHDAEPGLPIAFVRTDALLGTIIVFRKHVLRMGQRPDRWTPRADTPRVVSAPGR